MPNKCVVPGCNDANGHKFPIEKKRRKEWCVAIKRLVKKGGHLWEPVTGKEVVCKKHFVPSDYRPPTYGGVGK